jgi:hypothetical protein
MRSSSDDASPNRSALAVDLAAVPYGMNQQCLLCVQYLVDYPIVPDPQLLEPSEVAAQSLRFDCAEVRCQPVDTIDDASCLRLVQPRQVAGRGIQKASAQGHG